LCACLCLAFEMGCERASRLFQNGPDKSPRRTPPSPSAAEPGRVPGAPDAGRPHLKLDLAIRRKMKLALRGIPASDLAFGKGRFGALTDDSLVVRDVPRFAETLQLPLERPRALATLADGSLLAAGAARSFRLLPQDVKSIPVSRILLFPDSSLFGDRQNPDRVWVLPAFSKTLFGYDAVRGSGALQVAAQWIDLEEYDLRALTSIRDGSFLYTTSSGLVQFYGMGKKEPVGAALQGSFRLLPASRPDTVWAVADRSARLFRILTGRLTPLKSVELEVAAYDATAAGELLAVLELSQPDDAPWSFVLEVFDVGGQRRCRVPLPAEETLDDDWVARLIRDRGLALSADPPLVAVGGRTHADVFGARDGSRVFSSP
jgi:hypothetical protein